MDPALGRLAQAVLGPDDVEVEKALQTYGQAVACAARAGASSIFGREGPPSTTEETAFRETIKRARRVR
jgi:hypothetical protein